jgi:hypothetical protein
MPTVSTDHNIVSDVSDMRDQPLDAEVGFDFSEYARIMRRIGVAEGELGTPVSAFNSSI